MKILTRLLFVLALAGFGGVNAYYFLQLPGESTPAFAQIEPQVSEENGKFVKTFDVEAKAVTWQLDEKREITALTYNGVVPASQLRVKQGDLVRVNLTNKLNMPVTIHWHGYPVPNKMDGIPSVTQDAVMPDETFTYEFEATIPGTYWYHSHQDSANQVDRGLYGTLIVEGPDQVHLDRDYTLVLDEWMPPTEWSFSLAGLWKQLTNPEASHDHGGHAGMNHAGMDMGTPATPTAPAVDGSTLSPTPDPQPGKTHDIMMQQMYTIYTVNGKTGKAIQPLQVANGERVRLRFVNAGFMSQTMLLPGQAYQVVALDGQAVAEPKWVKDEPFSIAPGERYDIEFMADTQSDWTINNIGDSMAALGMTIPIKVDNSKTATQTGSALTTPAIASKFTPTTKYDVTKEMELGEKVGPNGVDPIFTINGKAFAEIENLLVKQGDKVKVIFINKGSSNHPMHLHGHFFQVLSKDGKLLEAPAVWKDTLNVKPGETFEVAFEADNPGDWMFHCHDLHHAAAGMVHAVHYAEYESFQPNPDVPNMPH